MKKDKICGNCRFRNTSRTTALICCSNEESDYYRDRLPRTHTCPLQKLRKVCKNCKHGKTGCNKYVVYCENEESKYYDRNIAKDLSCDNFQEKNNVSSFRGSGEGRT